MSQRKIPQTIEVMRLNEEFRLGKLCVYIVVTKDSVSNELSIDLIHRLRFGDEILPIPAWLSHSEAEDWLGQRDNLDGVIIEINHNGLQKMIDDGKYSQFYKLTTKYFGVSVASYFLDIQLRRLCGHSEVSGRGGINL